MKRASVTEISVHFDQMCWPRLNENFGILPWRIRYSQDSLSKEDLYRAASILEAFYALVNKSQKDRNYICSMLKKYT